MYISFCLLIYTSVNYWCRCVELYILPLHAHILHFFYCAVQLNVGCEHNDDGKDLDNIEDPKDFATENGLSTQFIDHMSKESYKVEMEGVACLEDLHMKDGTQVMYT